MRYLLVGWVFVLVAPPSFSADAWGPLTTYGVRREADLVIAGRIVEIIPLDSVGDHESRAIVRMAVGRVWKGDPPAIVSIYTYIGALPERPPRDETIKAGEEILLFANLRPASEWKGGAPPGARHQDLIDSLPANAPIYISGPPSAANTSWSVAEFVVRYYGAWHAPRGAIVMKDPPRLPESFLPAWHEDLPMVCWNLGDPETWKRLEAPPVDGALLEYRLRRTAAYRAVITGSIGQAKDTWVKRKHPDGYGLCRQMSPAPSACGALAVTFNLPPRRSGLATWDVESAMSDPCESGPL